MIDNNQLLCLIGTFLDCVGVGKERGQARDTAEPNGQRVSADHGLAQAGAGGLAS